MPGDDLTAVTPLDTLLDADREIARVGAADLYQLYELLHRTATRFAPAEAFYICLYSEADQSLYFPFNFDNGKYDYPSTFSLGDGPTSWVIRHKRPFIWKNLEEQESSELRGIHFGDLDAPTQSAVHLPMLTPGTGPDAPPLGVLSAHSYRPHAYGPEQIRLLQWLADRAGQALAHARATALAAERQRHAAALTDRFVQMLTRISQDAQTVGALTPPDCPALRQAVAEFLRTCYRSQTEANEFSMHPDRLPPPTPTGASTNSLAILTGRERDILRLLAAGHSNGEIARRLFIATNTVKDHLKRIFTKIGAASRYEATEWFRAAGQ